MHFCGTLSMLSIHAKYFGYMLGMCFLRMSSTMFSCQKYNFMLDLDFRFIKIYSQSINAQHFIKRERTLFTIMAFKHNLQ